MRKNFEARMTNVEGMTKRESIRDEELRWSDRAESVIREAPETNRVYDLEERMARFGEAIIDFAKTIALSPATSRPISQLFGAGTSVGANYVEVDDAVSKKEFLKNIGTCRKEAHETKHLLRMIARAVPELKLQARELWMEATELHLIFSNIWRRK
jgi:four helix bundle protein